VLLIQNIQNLLIFQRRLFCSHSWELQKLQRHNKALEHGGPKIGRVASAWSMEEDDGRDRGDGERPNKERKEIVAHRLLCREMAVIQKNCDNIAFGTVVPDRRSPKPSQLKLDIELPDGTWTPILTTDFQPEETYRNYNSIEPLSPDMKLSVNWREQLQNVAQPAQYGDLKSFSNKIDPKVRSALEIKQGKWRLHAPGYVRFPRKVRHSLKTLCSLICLAISPISLLASLAAAIGSQLILGFTPELEPYKLNIYREGDFFKPHVDAAVDPANMIGTLVVGLPVQHEGGELVVSAGRKSQSFSLAPQSDVTVGSRGNETDSSLLKWVALFSDCVHEVKPVRSGERVTLTYLIKKQRPASEKILLGEINKIFTLVEQGRARGGLAVENRVRRLSRVLQQVAADLKLNTFGLLLNRKYTSANLERQALKGIDELTYLAFLTAFPSDRGHKVVLHPVGYQISLSRDEHYSNERKQTTAVTSYRRSDLLHALGTSGEAEPLPFDTPVLFFQPHAHYDHKYGMVLSRREQKSAEHAGNECLPRELDATNRCGAIVCTLAK
jgi:hypothetical protein